MIIDPTEYGAKYPPHLDPAAGGYDLSIAVEAGKAVPEWRRAFTIAAGDVALWDPDDPTDTRRRAVMCRWLDLTYELQEK